MNGTMPTVFRRSKVFKNRNMVVLILFCLLIIVQQWGTRGFCWSIRLFLRSPFVRPSVRSLTPFIRVKKV